MQLEKLHKLCNARYGEQNTYDSYCSTATVISNLSGFIYSPTSHLLDSSPMYLL